jgi:hypothetical protein
MACPFRTGPRTDRSADLAGPGGCLWRR